MTRQEPRVAKSPMSRAAANEKVAEKLRQASESLKVEGDGLAPTLNASVENLSLTLANRIIGVDGGR